MNNHRDFFVSTPSSSTSAAAAHPLQVLLMRQCATPGWAGSRLERSLESAAPRFETPEPPRAAQKDEDALNCVSQSIVDLVRDVVPELPSRGRQGDGLQERITALLRQQLLEPPLLTTDASPFSPTACSPAFDFASASASTSFGLPLGLSESSSLATGEHHHPNHHLYDSSADRMSFEALDLVQSLSRLPRFGGTGLEDSGRGVAVETLPTLEGTRSPSLLDFPPSLTTEGGASLMGAEFKDDRSIARSEQPPWVWRDSRGVLQRSESCALSEQRFPRESTASIPPCLLNNNGSSSVLGADLRPVGGEPAQDDGLNNIMAEFVLQEFLKVQAAGVLSEHDGLSPKSCSSHFVPPSSFRDYVASPAQSASSGGRRCDPSPPRHAASADPALSLSCRSLRSPPQRSALLTRDVRYGAMTSVVDRELFNDQPPLMSRPHLPRTMPARSSQRRSTLVTTTEPLVPRSPLNCDRQAAMLAMAAAARKNNSAYSDDHDRMVYISWIPKQSRAYTTMDRRRMELELKKKLREEMHLEGVTKVLLFPPKGAHCKLIFDKRASAEKFMDKYGGDDGSEQSEIWKHEVCRAFGIVVNERFAKTVVKIEWSQK